MSENHAASYYEPLTGIDPDLLPEQWLIFLNDHEILLPQDGVVWAEPPGFLSKQRVLVTGRWGGKPVGAVLAPALAQAYQGASLRSVLNEASHGLFFLLSHSLQVLNAHKNHQFCGLCGAPTQPLSGHWAMHCAPCDHSTYPRISPCIIVLISKGKQLLLVQHKQHVRRAMHTVVAGFIEPGESAEQAVAREVMEETGLKLASISYEFSQSWPFPHSLMLGFHAEYLSGELRLDQRELLDGGWFSPDALPVLPPKFAISRQLIDRFLARSHP